MLSTLDYTVDVVGVALALRAKAQPLTSFQRMLLTLIDGGIDEDEAIHLATIYASQ